MDKNARVKDILEAYDAKGLLGVSRYLEDPNIIIDPSTWSGKMERLLKTKSYRSMEAEIASILFTFKLTPKDERRAAKELLNQRHENGRITSE
jgi:hypothetical protein